MTNIIPLHPDKQPLKASLEVLHPDIRGPGQAVCFEGIAPIALVQQFEALLALHNKIISEIAA